MAKAISDPHVLVPSPSIIFFAVHVDDIISAASLPEENPKEDDRGRGQPAGLPFIRLAKYPPSPCRSRRSLYNILSLWVASS
jgi:hypothetical protein